VTANKVPAPRSQAGPGCWQCADCGLIVSDDEDECRRCQQADRTLAESTETETGEQADLGGWS